MQMLGRCATDVQTPWIMVRTADRTSNIGLKLLLILDYRWGQRTECKINPKHFCVEMSKWPSVQYETSIECNFSWSISDDASINSEKVTEMSSRELDYKCLLEMLQVLRCVESCYRGLIDLKMYSIVNLIYRFLLKLTKALKSKESEHFFSKMFHLVGLQSVEIY